MAIFDEIYWEKGTEKYFYTLDEINKAAQVAKEKHIENRSVLKRMKHFFKSNQTVMEIDKDLRNDYKVKSEGKKPLELARILSDALIKSHFCCSAADFKSAPMEAYYKFLESEYNQLSKVFITKAFIAPETINNWEPVKQALAVQRGFGKEVQSQLIKIENFELIKQAKAEITEQLSGLKYEYKIECINNAKDRFKAISQFEYKDDYKGYFSLINKDVLLVNKAVSEQIENRIEKEKKQKHPSIKVLTTQMERYHQLETDFETFSSSYNNHKYKNELEKLQKLTDRMLVLAEKESATLKRITEMKSPYKLIIESAKRVDELTMILDQFTQDYKEILNAKHELQDSLNRYKQSISNKLEQLFLPIEAILNATISDVGSCYSWLEGFAQWKDLRQKLSGVVLLQNKFEAIHTEQLRKIKQWLLSYKLSRDNFDNAICDYETLKERVILAGLSSELLRNTEDVKKKGLSFKTDADIACRAIHSLQQSIAEDKLDAIDYDYNLLEKVVLKYKNNNVLMFADLKIKYETLLSEFELIKCSVKDVLEKLAFTGDLCLLHPISNKRYLFITSSTLEIGCANEKDVFYRNSKLHIPLASISGSHGVLDCSKLMYRDNNSTNGSYSAQSRVRKEYIDLNKDDDLNLAMQFTFDVKRFNQLAVLKLTWFDRNKENLVRFFNSTQEFIEFWGKLYIVLVSHDAVLYISKLNGEVVDQIDVEENYYKIEVNDRKYSFSDSLELISTTILRKGNTKIPLLVEK